MKQQSEVTIRIHCSGLPGESFEGHQAVRLGVQKGKEVLDDVPGDAKNVIFDIPLRVERNPSSGKPNFLGPYAQGKSDERFIYLSWGEMLDGSWRMFRRAKIHLNHLDWNTVEAAISSATPIEAFLEMTDKKGGPLCASVRPGEIHWQVSQSNS